MALYTKVKETDVKIGDEVQLVTNYTDGEKTKKQVFTGIVIAIKNVGVNKSFTVRKMTKSGIGVERIFPTAWPLLESIKVNAHNEVHRSKLYYMRERSGKRSSEV